MKKTSKEKQVQRAMTVEEIVEWINRPRELSLPQGDVMELYTTFHPRTAFLKMLPRDSRVADIGAGDGSLSIFRRWPAPEREDLKLFAYSIEKGERFDDYDGYEISDWNESQPDFDGGKFDAIVCAHFIEHISAPESLVDWASRKLKPGGRIYLEWPSPASLELPSRHELEQAGVSLVISRFQDDGTHKALPDADAIATRMEERGMDLEARAIVRIPWLEDEMIASTKDEHDKFPRQAAFWSYTGWSQYIVARKRGVTASTSARNPNDKESSRE